MSVLAFPSEQPDAGRLAALATDPVALARLMDRVTALEAALADAASFAHECSFARTVAHDLDRTLRRFGLPTTAQRQRPDLDPFWPSR